ncbi:MAG: hypothetical protein KDD89_05010 [Anaerolineales bacterium]|nr:hypothetical protein [Anaerolineales bacterium]
MLKNGSFEEPWTDLPPQPGYLINQQPAGWTISWVEQGQPLYDSQDKADGIPECVHKLSTQLPPNEQLGAKDALILDGSVTYKVFHFAAPFGAELRQTVRGLKPGTTGKLIAPILAVLYDEQDEYGVETGAWVDTVGSDKSDDWAGQWVTGRKMGDRKWYEHEVSFMVPASGTVTVILRVKGKWARPKDFFFDHIRLEAVAAEEGSGSSVTPTTAVATLHLPIGYQVRTQIASGDDKQIVVSLPPGVTLNVVEPDAG